MQPLVYLFGFGTIGIIILLLFVTISTLPRERFSNYLVAMFTATTTIILIFLTVIILPKERSIFENKTYDQLYDILLLKDNQLTQYIQERKKDLSQVATLGKEKRFDPQTIESQLQSYPEVAGVTIYKPDGTLLFQTTKNTENFQFTTLNQLSETHADVSVATPYVFTVLADKTILVATLYPEHLQTLLSYGFTEQKGIEVYGVNTGGKIVDPVRIPNPGKISNPEILSCRSAQSGFNQRDNYESKIVFSAWKWSEEANICIIADDPARHAQQPFNELQLVQLTTSIAAIFITLGISYIISRRLVAPIINLRNASKLIGEGKLNTRIVPKGPLEIYELAIAFNRMGDDLTASNEYRTTLIRQKENEVKKIHTILDTIADGVIVLDDSGTIILINPVMSTLLGIPSAKLLQQQFSHSIELLSEDGKRKLTDGTPVTSQTHSNETKCLLKISNGQTIPVSVIVSALVEETVLTGQVIIFRDISKDKEIEKMKDDFISLISHQLRTPLTAIRWISKKMLDKKDLPEERRMQDINDIYSSSLRLISLVGDLLNISRIETGKIQVVIEEINISDVVSSVIDEIEKAPSDKSVSISKEIPKDIHIDTDQKLIRQVIQNLVDNAVKYSNQNGHVHVSLTEKDLIIELKVLDNGKGISQEEQAHIFTKYYRAKNVTQMHYTEGNGLGLYFCKQIVELLKGTIFFDSELDKGTTFTVVLPKHIEHTTS